MIFIHDRVVVEDVAHSSKTTSALLITFFSVFGKSFLAVLTIARESLSDYNGICNPIMYLCLWKEENTKTKTECDRILFNALTWSVNTYCIQILNFPSSDMK